MKKEIINIIGSGIPPELADLQADRLIELFANNIDYLQKYKSCLFNRSNRERKEIIESEIKKISGITIGKGRKMPDAKYRQLVIFILRKKTVMTVSEIGKLYGLQHSTVIHAIKAVDDILMTKDKVYYKNFIDIIRSFS